MALLPLFPASAQSVAPPSDASDAAPIQRPAELEADAPASDEAAPAPDEAAPAPEPAPKDAAAVPEAPADDTAAETTDEAVAAEPPAAEPAELEPEPPDESIDPDLLAGDRDEPRPRPTTLRPQVVDPDAEAAALRKQYQEQFRPADNPGRLSLGVRALFANAGGRDKIGGRMGGAQLDVGQNWNHIGYAVTAQLWGGRVFLPRETGAEMNAMFGAGPTLTMGRLVLLGKGYLDLRVGYDFFYAVVNQRRDQATVVAPQNDPNAVALVQAENLAPHGPRASLQMGLLTMSRHRRFFHGFGVSAGYQGLVHSFRGDLPYTHMLTLGLSYWMG